MIRITRRIQCFYDLAKAGTEEDVAPLQKIVNDSSESEPVRTSAQYAIDMIRVRPPETPTVHPNHAGKVKVKKKQAGKV